MVTVIFRDKTWEVKPGSTVRHIIQKADLNPESILAVLEVDTSDGDVEAACERVADWMTETGGLWPREA